MLAVVCDQAPSPQSIQALSLDFQPTAGMPFPYMTAADTVDLADTGAKSGFELVFAVSLNTVSSVKYVHTWS